MLDGIDRGRAIRFLLVFLALVIIAIYSVSLALARDSGQWSDADPMISAWFKSIKMPDHPTISCCGEADAWYADETETGPNGELIAIITDERPDEPLRRRHIPIGTKIVVPPSKIQWRYGNPVGHVIIFLNPDNDVWCYVQNGGV